ncbi:putative deshydratase, CoA-transferase; L-carnitine dehydratase/bile acid-inducible protein family [Cupriavidus taiwanensis]|uniref:Deshydratase, CoA-transferase L-carnitine dehydratase/bile acid-inducible protein family n=1 Tax=Cupriavidus taiwanensis TaxID=164546 RepID=A0A375EBK4_9BURK|nr:CoA transferase [Cupriavidus taiwanensis]SOZ67935.1 putative deshydratase, CoA-transferase; L-carnitine dehydratase/bile acid-inducible protein family [Cupriavidus taiwanensis]SOZ68889.1 putative deshydratase, CoA-transferase; L-carnitine dehydratase/bile acid-inducible protein family [Cupriavidus taiwanensis]SOZ72543.1 putative deshydratase, CoA-transferase; L-carnitine dehydratase/bile acid-inducible protein family [Cupriavidus taiwanensis]SPA09538.1 putative deshydratase, CoA-transferase;
MTQANPGALAGIRVVDLSRILGGPYCGQILGDHGADVLKIEPPQGDDTRTWGPPFKDGVASYYFGLNRNKRVMRLDLTAEPDREVLLALLADADVLVENFKTGTLEKWGLGYDVLSARFPRLVHCRVSGFGADGPLGGLPGYDAAIQAMSGILSINGEADGDPLRVGLPVVDMVTGLNAVIGVLLALQERARSGRGQFVEAALYDSGLSLLHPHAANWFMSGTTPQRTGNAHPNIYPYDTVATGTDPIFLAVGNDRQFRILCEHLQVPALADDERYATAGARSVNRVALKAELEARMRTRDGKALADTLVAAGVPCAPVLSVADALQHPHTRHREMVVEMEGGYQGLGAPVKLSRTPATYRHAPLTEGSDFLE